MSIYDLVELVKQNLVIEFSADDSLITSFVQAAISYAEAFQHLPDGYYHNRYMSDTTRQAVVMLATHFYESRDGSTAGFWADKPEAANAVWQAVNSLLRLEREWKV